MVAIKYQCFGNGNIIQFKNAFTGKERCRQTYNYLEAHCLSGETKCMLAADSRRLPLIYQEVWYNLCTLISQQEQYIIAGRHGNIFSGNLDSGKPVRRK